MPRAVKLMPVPVRETLVRLAYGEVDVEISAVFLMRLDIVNEAFYFCFKLRIALLLQYVSRALHPLGDIRIPKEMRLIRHARLPIESKRADSSGFAEPVIYGIHGGVSVEQLLFVQKSAF